MSIVARPGGFEGEFRTDTDARDVYAEAAGVQRIQPLAVAVPRDERDVSALIEWAGGHGLPVIPRGSGSSMSGAAVGCGVILDMGRLSALQPANAAWARIRVGAGATRDALAREAHRAGLHFPIDPSSGAFATVGGMAGTNAAGPFSLGHGSMRRWVNALDCVLADGTYAVIRRGSPISTESPILRRWSSIATDFRERCAAAPRRRVRKDSSGYALHDFAASGDLVDLLVGSEGTLAVFTGVTVSLALPPVGSATVLTSWRSVDDAVVGARLAVEAGAAACELLEETLLRLAEIAGPLPFPAGTRAVLLVDLEDRSQDGASARAAALARASRSAKATSAEVGAGAGEADRLRAIRHAASPSLAVLDPHLRSMQLVEDGCVPADRFGEYVRRVRAALDRAGLRGVLFGHAGDANLHANALVDVRREDWRARVRTLMVDVHDAVADLGGTLTGEHGDGRLRTPFLRRTWPPEAIALFDRLKDCFDPRGILNPGVKSRSADAGEVLSSIKYDPLLPPLSPRARRVLDFVERDRAYAVNRLEMLDRAD